MKKVIGSILAIMILAVAGTTAFAANQKPAEGKTKEAAYMGNRTQKLETAVFAARTVFAADMVKGTISEAVQNKTSEAKEAAVTEAVYNPVADSVLCPNESCPMNGECSYPDCPYGGIPAYDGSGYQGANNNNASYQEGWCDGTGYQGGGHNTEAGNCPQDGTGRHHGRNR